MGKNRKILYMVVTLLFWMSLYSYVSFLSTYSADRGASLFMIGIVLASYGVTQTLLRIPLGVLSDKLNKRKIFIQMGIMFSAVGATCVFIFDGVAGLIVLRSMTGVAAASWVSFSILYASYHDSEDIPKALGMISAVLTAGQLSGTFIGGFFANSYGVESSFMLAAVVGGTAFLLSFFIKENPNIERTPMTMSNFLSVAKDKSLLYFSIITIVLQMVVFSTLFGFTPTLAQDLGANDLQKSLITTLSGLPVLLASALSGTFFVKKLGAKKSLILSFSLMSIMTCLLSYSPNLTWLVIIQCINNFGRGLGFVICMSYAVKNITPGLRSTAMGFFQAIYGLGMIAGPYLTGWLGGIYSLNVALIIIGIITFITMLSLFFIKGVWDKPQTAEN